MGVGSSPGRRNRHQFSVYGFLASVSSRHPGIVNVLFADGSVHGIKNMIAINVWWALGTRANGEVISADS